MLFFTENVKDWTGDYFKNMKDRLRRITIILPDIHLLFLENGEEYTNYSKLAFYLLLIT